MNNECTHFKTGRAPRENGRPDPPPTARRLPKPPLVETTRLAPLLPAAGARERGIPDRVPKRVTKHIPNVHREGGNKARGVIAACDGGPGGSGGG